MIVYLATPYSHPDKYKRLMRFDIACEVAAWAMSQGYTVFCPIAHSHPIAAYLPKELLLSHEFWMKQDLPLLAKCDEVWVYPNDAADVSRGVAREIEDAKRLGIKVRYITPEMVYG